MKVSVVNFYTLIFVVAFLMQLYIPSFKINIVIQILILSFLFLNEKPKISLSFIKTIQPILMIIGIGFIGMFLYKYKSYNIIKDIFHFLKPLVALLIGYFFYKRIDNLKIFIRTIVIIGFISSIIHYYIMFFVNSGFDTVHSMREFSRDNILELFALFFLSFYKKFQNESLFANKLFSKIIFASLLLSCILYFSRTMILITIMVLLTIHGYTIITTKSLKIIVSVVVAIIGLYIVLFSSNIQRNKEGIESFLYKLKMAPAEVFETKIDRENHADLWDHWRGYEAKRAFALLNEHPQAYIIGSGYGSVVNLKFYAPLSDDEKGMKYISELHNGYVFILYKVGIFGLLLYLFFLYKLYMRIYDTKTFQNVFISAISVSLAISAMVIGSAFNGHPTFLILLGSLLYFNEKQNVITND